MDINKIFQNIKLYNILSSKSRYLSTKIFKVNKNILSKITIHIYNIIIS